ncbi:nucleotidyltransferase family protein [Streptosporangium soli]|nr:nucleotidyltransferase family protein [Streptosporangium sp. KLBMP 9127]
MVLAAGTGSRLAPYTDHIPKPLLPVLDRPLLGDLLDQLAAAGAQELFVNLAHHAEQVASYLTAHRHRVPVRHRVEPRLTGPAGALAVFAGELAAYDAVLVVSGDIVVGGALDGLVRAHGDQRAELTFGVTRARRARRYGVLEIDHDGRVLSAVEKPDVPDEEEHWISTGAYCLAPTLVSVIADLLLAGAPSVDYARDLAPALLAEGRRVTGHHLAGYWRDIGTPASLVAANLDAVNGRIPRLSTGRPGLRSPASADGPAVFVHPTAELAAGVEFGGPAVVGAGARIGAGAWLCDSVVLPGAVVPAGAVLHGGLLGTTGLGTTGPGTAGNGAAANRTAGNASRDG